MLHDVGLGGQCTEESMVIIIGKIFVDKFHSFGNFFTIDIKLHIVKF